MSTEKTKKPTNPDAVGNAVIDILGKPPQFIEAQSINVFGDHWRVNIRTANKENQFLTTSHISDSFLVEFKKNKITGGDEIVKKY